MELVIITPPAVEALIPDVTNMSYFRFTGRTEPGVAVTLNGEPVEVDACGLFKAWVNLKETPIMRLEATDSAGIRTTVEKRPRVENTGTWWQWHRSSATVSGKAMPGSLITNPVTPDSPVLSAGADGTWQWEQPLGLDLNDLWLLVTPPAGTPVYYHYQWFRAVTLDLPATTELASVSVTGRVAPDWSLRIDGRPAVPDAAGRITFAPELKPGVNLFAFEYTSFTGQRYQCQVRILRK